MVAFTCWYIILLSLINISIIRANSQEEKAVTKKDDEDDPYTRHIIEEGVNPPLFGSNSYDPIKQVFELTKKPAPPVPHVAEDRDHPTSPGTETPEPTEETQTEPTEPAEPAEPAEPTEPAEGEATEAPSEPPTESKRKTFRKAIWWSDSNDNSDETLEESHKNVIL